NVLTANQLELFNYAFPTATLILASNKPHTIPRELLRQVKEIGCDNFGLSRYVLTYPASQVINLLRTSSWCTVWILFSKSFKFKNPHFNIEDYNDLLQQENNKIVFNKGYHMSLCYGTLISMNKFHWYSSNYHYEKKSNWIIRFIANRAELVEMSNRTVLRRVITAEHLD
ncbi:unnamed protein product, partial [Didymodactylos carnosus]